MLQQGQTISNIECLDYKLSAFYTPFRMCIPHLAFRILQIPLSVNGVWTARTAGCYFPSIGRKMYALYAVFRHLRRSPHFNPQRQPLIWRCGKAGAWVNCEVQGTRW